MTLRIENGWAIIEAAGMSIKVPAEFDSMADDRAEIYCNGVRIYVEAGKGGPVVSEPELVSCR